MHAPNMESKPLQEFDYFLVPYLFCLFLFLSEPSELWTWGNTTDGAAWSTMEIEGVWNKVAAAGTIWPVNNILGPTPAKL